MSSFMNKIKGKLSSDKRKSVVPDTTSSSTPAADSTAPAASTPAADSTPAAPAAAAATETKPEMASNTYTGKCHCGHHTFSVDLNGEQQAHVLCHCDACKVLGGGAFTMNQIIPKAALKITSGGEPGVYTYKGDSGKSVNCYFCPKCTTHLYHHQEVMGPDMIVVRTALLADGRKNFPVGAEIFGMHKMSWEKEVAHTFDALPPH